MSSFSKVDVVNAATLEKVLLGQKVGAFLRRRTNDHDLDAILKIATILAQDICEEVRETLAFELRTCKHLPYDLAQKIASDIESVSGPFLATTEAFTDLQLAHLVPSLEAFAHTILARRSDVGPRACQALIHHADEKAVGYLVRNSALCFEEEAFRSVITRFKSKQDILDILAVRTDLPITIVEELIVLVAEEYRQVLVSAYGIENPIAQQLSKASGAEAVWRQVVQASPSQIHAYVIEMKKAGRFSEALVRDIVARGCLPFLESMLALEAGLTLGAVRESLYSGNMLSYVSLMKKANVSKNDAQTYLDIVKLHGSSADWPFTHQSDSLH